MRNNALEILPTWIKTHRENYVAHAVWANNVAGVLTEGKIHSAEYQLRKGKGVSCENRIHRRRIELSIADVMPDLKRTGFSLPPPSPMEHMHLFDAKKYNLITEEDFNTIVKIGKEQDATGSRFSATLQNGKKYNVFCGLDSNPEYKFNLEGMPSIPYYYAPENENFNQELLSHARHSLPEFVTQWQGGALHGLRLGLDEIAARPIDHMLCDIWNQYQQLCINNTPGSFFVSDLNQFRRSYLGVTFPVSDTIRACYCAVAWGYGDVVVLRGNSTGLLSVMNLPRRQRWQDFSCRKGQEVFLLAPFENGGEFFFLNLAHQDTLVIGPEHILSQYQADAFAKGIRLVCIEHMNEKQLDFFAVPADLRYKKSPATAVYSETSIAFFRPRSTSPVHTDVDVISDAISIEPSQACDT